MAAVSQTITGNTASAEFTPTKTVSEVSISPFSEGRIELHSKIPGGEYESLGVVHGKFAIPTPDFAILYVLQPINLVNSVQIYIGP